MDHCSDCGESFQKRVVRGRQSWRCNNCGRVLVGFAVLKQTHKRLVTRLHYRSSKYNRLSPNHCVACGTPWQRVRDEDYGDYMEICRICQWAWLPADFEAKLGPEEKNWNDTDPYEQRQRHHDEAVNESYREIQKQSAIAISNGVKASHRNKSSITRRLLYALSGNQEKEGRDYLFAVGLILQYSTIIGFSYYALRVVGFDI